MSDIDKDKTIEYNVSEGEKNLIEDIRNIDYGEILLHKKDKKIVHAKFSPTVDPKRYQ
jgi:hypothetical protein